MDEEQAGGRPAGAGKGVTVNVVPPDDRSRASSRLNRRRFLGWGTKAVIGVTSAVGSVAAFAPSSGADAVEDLEIAVDAAVNCYGGTYTKISRNCYYSCRGACSNYLSNCSHGGETTFSCYCSGNCSLATGRFQAYCKCKSATNNGYCCCKTC
jgi:hypothetical protein